MSTNARDFDLYLPTEATESDAGDRLRSEAQPVRKFSARLNPGERRYDIHHDLQTERVLVQTSIAGRVREGGIVILDANTVRIEFGGPLHEAMDVVIVG